MKQPSSQKILAIESSCDDTGAAIVDEHGTIYANCVASQANEHAKTSGVVPEVAARRHTEHIIPTIQQALKESGITMDEVTHIAVTNRPGLLPSLQIGVETAKALALANNLPLIPVNHLDAHIATAFIQDPAPTFPTLSLLVSGGHTEWSLHTDESARTKLGETRDDAAGEAFDKVARLLGLPYPGGPQISAIARNGKRNRFPFPRPMLHDVSFDVSFSGLKTDVARTIKELPQPLSEQDKADIAASFEEAIVDTLVQKTLRATEEHGTISVILAGGVAANTHLRDRLNTALNEHNIPLHVPPLDLCTDNAAMIGIAAKWAEPKNPSTVKAIPTQKRAKKIPL